MSSRNSRKDPAKPATRSNYIATPAANQLRDATLPQGMTDADPLGGEHPRIDTLATGLFKESWDTYPK